MDKENGGLQLTKLNKIERFAECVAGIQYEIF